MNAPQKMLNDTTRLANEERVLTPRFYTTDFDALEKLDLSPVRAEWDQMMAEFDSDGNVDHFQRPADFTDEIQPLPPALEKEFIDFMVTSVTSEYSGCALYQDIADAVDNPDVKKLMKYMARDEARHAGFINKSLKDYGLAVDLGYLRRQKKVTFFRPKFIYYATYLSEKIGYARYITIFRQLERHPEKRFHPMFRWFERWCNDEFRHGEAFALIMRSDPKLLSGVNRLWIRFFLLAVYATMFVRDHSRPEMHDAMGLDATAYDYQVFEITSEISKQVFPFTLDTDHPQMRRWLDQLVEINERVEAAQAQGGVLGAIKRGVATLSAAAVLTRMYLLPVVPNELPEQVRMAPAW